MSHSPYISIILCIMALSAWGGVVYAHMSVHSVAGARSEEAATLMQQTDRAALAQRLTSLAEGTREERFQLEAYAHRDIVSIVTALESAGTGLGVVVQVNSATPGSPAELEGGSTLHSYSLLVQADGGFSEVMRVAERLESLPLLSSLETLEFSALDTDAGLSVWRMNARIQALTTAAD